MTLQELNEYLELGETLERNEELLANLESAAHPGAQVMTGMPHATGIKDRVGDLAIEIADMREDIEAIRLQIDQRTDEVQQFIREIPDAQLRLVFRLRFVRRLSWKEAAGVMGRYKTAASAKNLVYSYMAELERIENLSGAPVRPMTPPCATGAEQLQLTLNDTAVLDNP